MSSLAARSPGKRKSLGHSLGERNLNTTHESDGTGVPDNQQVPGLKGKGKMRSNKSIGGGEDPAKLTSPSKITFSVGAGSSQTLSPKSQARRNAVCFFPLRLRSM